ncbi:TauD/TfdA family dioxygenase, partial [Streptomyces zhihengii]|uniref:TauD/TfdA family dioxygenase n=1 Tax=Streptomyces zhihengii TaxID=1818004 RepID=UPI0033A58BFF
HRWCQGDLVVWDNLATLHTASPFPSGRPPRRNHEVNRSESRLRREPGPASEHPGVGLRRGDPGGLAHRGRAVADRPHVARAAPAHGGAGA